MLWPLSVVLVANNNGRLAIPALAGLLVDYVVISDTINTFKNQRHLMHIGNIEIFYFIFEQPIPEPEIRD